MKTKYLSGILLLSLGLATMTACDDDEQDYTIQTKPLVTTVETGTAEVTAVSAIATGMVEGLSNQSASAYQVGVYYSTSEDPKTAGTKVVGSLKNDTITATLTGLTTNQTYYYCTFVTLQGKLTYFADEVNNFTTTNAVIETLDVTTLTAASAEIGAGISGTDGISVEIGCGVKLAVATDATVAENVAQNGYDIPCGTLSGTSFTLQQKGLLPNTTYTYVPYINLGSGYVYGQAKNFTTAEATYEYVDLGLSVLWATCNVGAESEEEAGALFGYGDLTGFNTSTDLADYADGNIFGSGKDIAKTIGYGRLPNADNIKELVNACQYEWTTVNGVVGARFTATNGNSIFLPAAGMREGTTAEYAGVAGAYWSGSVNADNNNYAQTLDINSSNAGAGAEFRYKALSVRPVLKAPVVMEQANLFSSASSTESKTWYLDLDAEGASYLFDGPLYYYGTDDSWVSVSNEDQVAGDSWLWAPVWADNTWLCNAQDFGSMTFHADGKVTVDDKSNNITGEGTWTIDEANHTLTLQGVNILHISNFHDIVTNWSTSLKILSLDENGMQLGVLRDNSSEGPCLLAFNYISADSYKDHIKPVWQGCPAGLSYAAGGWNPSFWASADSKTCTDITSATGTWTVSGTLSEAGSGAEVFVIDIFDFCNRYDTTNLYAAIDKILLDGTTELAVDNSKIIYGDIENNGNFRIEIYNAYGAGTKDNSPIDISQLNPQSEIAVTFTLDYTVPTYQAELCLWDGNDSNWGSFTANVSAEAGKQFSVKAEGSRAAAKVFILDIVGLAADYPNAIVRLDKVVTDGTEVAFDGNKLHFGDIEGNGKYRIELYNIWGDGTNQDSPFGSTSTEEESALAFNESMEVFFTIVTLEGIAAELTVCDSKWVSSWPDATTMLSPIKQFPAEFTINYEGSRANGMINLIEIQNILASFPNTQLTLKTITVDGTEVAFDASKIAYGDLEDNGKYRVEIYNTYGSTKGNAAFEEGEADGNSVIPALGFTTSTSVTFTLDKLY